MFNNKIEKILENSICIMEISNNICMQHEDSIFGNKDLKNFEKIFNYYNYFFDETLNCNIYICDIPYEAATLPGKIILSTNFI